ncbi:enolase C-terminal domain-like protein [Streptomyces avermitilis]|uniref:enolase C-terminal domain-like protein n=1 Tax=Streptomyces avermitilis TaxID=33903 RepID=UPI0033D9A250
MPPPYLAPPPILRTRPQAGGLSCLSSAPGAVPSACERQCRAPHQGAGQRGRAAAGLASLLPPGAMRFVEDPLPGTEMDAYRELRTQCSLPVAFGERLSDATGARELLELGPAAFTFDVAWCRGITEACTWMALAEQAGVPVHLHGRAFLPALHLAAAFPHVAGPVKYQVVWEPKRQRALSGTVVLADGWAALPERPGLGLEVRCCWHRPAPATCRFTARSKNAAASRICSSLMSG